MKSTIPLKITRFTADCPTARVNTDMVEDDMCGMMDWICEQEKLFFTSPLFTTIVDNILNGTIVLKGSLNSLGRQLDIEPTTPYPYQPFNMNEMLRTTIVQKLFGYVQAEALFRVFHTLEERPTEHEALTLFKKQYPTITTPTVAFTETSIHRYYDKNVRCATIPGGVQCSSVLGVRYAPQQTHHEREPNFLHPPPALCAGESHHHGEDI